MANEVYDPSNRNYKIDFVYLYYVDKDTLKANDGLNLYEIPLSEPSNMTDDDIEELIFRADRGKFPVKGSHVEARRWRHRSYLLFVLRHDLYRFEKGNAITFSHKEGGRLGGNHTFRDGRDAKLADPNVTAMVCTNLRKNKLGQPLGDGETEYFKVTFNTKPPFVDDDDDLAEAGRGKARATGAGPQMRLHDETGTNTGP
jgi:hypothetical protein